MPELVKLLSENKLTLIVDLPHNDAELAEAALAGGADALQLHINANGFNSFENEKENLGRIVKKCKIPVGIVPGLDVIATEPEMKEIRKMGFDFINMDMELAPPYMLKMKGISKVLALNSKFSLERLMANSKEEAEALDAAIVPASGWGKDLVVGDLQNYISIVMSTGVPVIIPTERSIRPSETAIIADTGAKGILITPVVTGTTAKHIENAVREFRVEVDNIED